MAGLHGSTTPPAARPHWPPAGKARSPLYPDGTLVWRGGGAAPSYRCRTLDSQEREELEHAALAALQALPELIDLAPGQRRRLGLDPLTRAWPPRGRLGWSPALPARARWRLAERPRMRERNVLAPGSSWVRACQTSWSWIRMGGAE